MIPEMQRSQITTMFDINMKTFISYITRITPLSFLLDTISDNVYNDNVSFINLAAMLHFYFILF